MTFCIIFDSENGHKIHFVQPDHFPVGFFEKKLLSGLGPLQARLICSIKNIILKIKSWKK